MRHQTLAAPSVMGTWVNSEVGIFVGKFGDGYPMGPYRLPPPLSPIGEGSMPLYCCAHWIAANGGTVDFDLYDSNLPETFSAAFEELCTNIGSEEVSGVTGLRDGKRERIDCVKFQLIKFQHPFSNTDLSFGDEPELFLLSCLDVDGPNDSLVMWRPGRRFDDTSNSEWSKLAAPKSEIRKRWPFTVRTERSESTEWAGTGAPGRPTSIDLVRTEYRARCERGDVNHGIGEEAAELSRWLLLTHPAAPQLKPKTIENQLRADHRARQSKPRK